MVHSPEFIERLRKRMRENNPARNPEVRKKISKTWFKKGDHPSKETEFKQGDKGHLGYKHSEETKKRISKNHKGKLLGIENPKWKGDKVGYCALHTWIKRMLGKPTKCVDCGQNKGRIEWANISREYKREINDWKSLCKKCHYRFDNQTTPERDSSGRFIKLMQE